VAAGPTPYASGVVQKLFTAAALFLIAFSGTARADDPARPRAADLGLKVGILPAGPLDAITDVAGVTVGQTTLIRGDDIRTGVTAIVPHPGNLYREKVPAAIYVGNGYGKLTGVTQVEELGEIETPILLTSTLSVPRVADALMSYMLALPGNEKVQSVNPIVGETNDGTLNDIRGRHISAHHHAGAAAGGRVVHRPMLAQAMLADVAHIQRPKPIGQCLAQQRDAQRPRKHFGEEREDGGRPGHSTPCSSSAASSS